MRNTDHFTIKDTSRRVDTCISSEKGIGKNAIPLVRV